jgi:hypothetical protein
MIQSKASPRMLTKSEEAVLIFLDRTGLSGSVYRTCDLSALEDLLIARLEKEKVGILDGHEIRPTETVIYLYGTDPCPLPLFITFFLMLHFPDSTDRGSGEGAGKIKNLAILRQNPHKTREKTETHSSPSQQKQQMESLEGPRRTAHPCDLATWVRGVRGYCNRESRPLQTAADPPSRTRFRAAAAGGSENN